MNLITLPVAELKPALVGLGKNINKRMPLPVLSHVRIERNRASRNFSSGTALSSEAVDDIAPIRAELRYIDGDRPGEALG
jgi:hypothetical protein